MWGTGLPSGDLISLTLQGEKNKKKKKGNDVTTEMDAESHKKNLAPTIFVASVALKKKEDLVQGVHNRNAPPISHFGTPIESTPSQHP